MENLNFTLKLINGSITLLTASLMVFLTFYLIDALKRFSRTPDRTFWWEGLPLSIPFAAIFFVNNLGTLITRSVVWAWRAKGGGSSPFDSAETYWLLIGAVVTAFAMLIMIRFLSKPRFGHWPWATSMVITSAYILWTVCFNYP